MRTSSCSLGSLAFSAGRVCFCGTWARGFVVPPPATTLPGPPRPGSRTAATAAGSNACIPARVPDTSGHTEADIPLHFLLAMHAGHRPLQHRQQVVRHQRQREAEQRCPRIGQRIHLTTQHLRQFLERRFDRPATQVQLRHVLALARRGDTFDNRRITDSPSRVGWKRRISTRRTPGRCSAAPAARRPCRWRSAPDTCAVPTPGVAPADDGGSGNGPAARRSRPGNPGCRSCDRPGAGGGAGPRRAGGRAGRVRWCRRPPAG